MIGVISFILILLVLVLVHEWGHFIVARIFGVGVEEFGFGFPPRLTFWQGKRTTYSLNWLPLGGFVRLKGEELADGTISREPDSFAVQGVLKRISIVVAGVLMNLVLAVFLLTVGYSVGLPQPLNSALPDGAIISNAQNQVVGVIAKSPADGSLLPGDIILSIDGLSFTALADLQAYIRTYTIKNGGEKMVMAIERNKQIENIAIAPEKFVAPNGEQTYGVGIELYSSGLVSYPVPQALVVAVKMVEEMIVTIFVTLYDLLIRLIGGQPQGVEVAGPVGIAVIAGQAAGLGWRYILEFAAVLSINLAVINILPIPGLDGGRLFFLAYEAVFRRKVSAEAESRIHGWGFVVLLLLVLTVTAIDIGRLIRH